MRPRGRRHRRREEVPAGRPGGGRRGATREEDEWREVQGAREGEAESVMASVRR